MAGEPANPILLIVAALVFASLVLLAAGLMLRRRGPLSGPAAALGWALLTMAPLFGGGLYLFVHDPVQIASGAVPLR